MNTHSSPFTAENLLTALQALPATDQYYVAYSGGLDSHALLHALSVIKSTLAADIHALHVNHGLSPAAANWAAHCGQTCEALAIDFTLLKIDTNCPRGASREAWARRLRYQLLTSRVTPAGILLTAHHQDDQAETLLLQLMRGAGVRGMAAMPVLTERDGRWHARPLLHVSRAQLRTYAKAHKLQWVEDESNSDLSYDRNFFRGKLMPLLRQRWPHIDRTLGRAATHQAEAMSLLDDLGAADVVHCRGASGGGLNVARILTFSAARQANLIRHWLRQLRLPVPDSRNMEEILTRLLPARADATPLIQWRGGELRRYRQTLYAAAPLPSHDGSTCINWQLDSPCHLSTGVLRAKLAQGRGIRIDICSQRQLQVRFRQGGEKIRLANKAHHQRLKKLFQERGIPPWRRDRLPLLYAGDALIAVADLWIAAAARSTGSEISWHIHWHEK